MGTGFTFGEHENVMNHVVIVDVQLCENTKKALKIL